MRKIVWVPICLVVLVIAGWGAFYAYAELRARDYAYRQWPVGLGRIADVPRRHPATEMNAAAAKLTTLADALEINFRARRRAKQQPEISKYVSEELARTAPTIEAPPVAVAAYLKAHEADIAAVRQHLLASPIRWRIRLQDGAEAPIPNLVAHMTLARVLIASALDRARLGDAGAWDELHALWMIDRSLWSRPELITSMIALATTKMLNNAARKMPLPEPAWMGEVRAYDYRRAMLATWQGEAVMFVTTVEREARGIRVIGRPYLRLSTNEMMEYYRDTADGLAKVTDCEFDEGEYARLSSDAISKWNVMGKIAMPNLAAVWQRLFRFQAELEATERINQIRAGGTPTLHSRCAEGKWLYDGGKLSFSVPIADATPRGTDQPLTYP